MANRMRPQRNALLKVIILGKYTTTEDNKLLLLDFPPGRVAMSIFGDRLYSTEMKLLIAVGPNTAKSLNISGTTLLYSIFNRYHGQ